MRFHYCAIPFQTLKEIPPRRRFDQLARLTEALASNESTERLDLEGCAIGDQGCTLIRDLLMTSNRIKHVDLQMNQITDVGCKALAEGIPKNKGLKRLYCEKQNLPATLFAALSLPWSVQRHL